MAERQHGVGQTAEVEAGGIQVRQLIVVVVACQAGDPAFSSVGGFVDDGLGRRTPLLAAVGSASIPMTVIFLKPFKVRKAVDRGCRLESDGRQAVIVLIGVTRSAYPRT